jgi:tRNA-splicing ligase RtcB
MKTRQLLDMGIPHGRCVELAIELLKETARRKLDDREVSPQLKALVRAPASFADHELYGPLARALAEYLSASDTFIRREAPAPYKIWGEGLEAGALQQMANAAQLPVAACGRADARRAPSATACPSAACWPPAAAVIPYAVGVDIACRMKLTVLDMPVPRARRAGGPPGHGADRGDPLRRGRDVPRPARARGDGCATGTREPGHPAVP